MDVIINAEHIESDATTKTVHDSHCKSRDDLHIGKVKLHPDPGKKNCSNKYSKSSRNPNLYKHRKLIEGSGTIGERKPSMSKLAPSQFKIRKDEKLKPSRIPRRKSFTKEIGEKENTRTSKIGPNSYQLPTATNNVQRVQLLINPDFVHHKHIPTNSLAVSRPIPALGQIYTPDTNMDRERLNDWFLELHAPVNSLESNQMNSNVAPESISDNSTRGVINADLEYPTRDDESGYRSLSPSKQTDVRSKHSDGTSVVKQSKESYCLTLTSDTNFDGTSTSGLINDKRQSRLTEQPTVIIGKVVVEGVNNYPGKNDSLSPMGQQPSQIAKSDLSKNYQFPSDTCPLQTEENHNIPVPSYVDCPSEMLQKTTNFEGEGYESPKTISSIAATDLEIRDDLSSQSTLEQMDDCSLSEDQTNVEWCHHQSKRTMGSTKPSTGSDDTTFAEWDYHYRNDSCHHNHCHTCCKRRRYEIAHQGDAKRRSKREQDRFKRFPSSRYKLKHLTSLRRRLSFRRICRRRWHSVWKKTAERWAMWSKSPTKLKRLRLMHYLQRSIIWEDADVQTPVLAYRETGTDTALKEQKSAGIATSFKLNSWMDTASSRTRPSSNKTRLKHVNLGPSMFPLCNNSNRKSLPLQNITETKPIKRFNSYPESNKNRYSSNRLGFPFYSKQNSRTENMIRNESLNDNILVEEDRVKETGVQKSCLLSNNIMCGANISRKSIGTEQLQMLRNDGTCGAKLSNKNTGTNRLQMCNDRFTSTMLHLSSMKLSTPSKDAYTQVLITCNTAETGIMFHPSWNSSFASTLTTNSLCSYRKSFATNTEAEPRPMKAHNIASVMTSIAIMKRVVNSETQVTPTPSVRKVSTGFCTSLSVVSEKTSTFHTGSLENIEKKDVAAQILPQGPVLTVTGTKIMSISSAKMLTASAITSRRDLASNGMLTSQTHFRSGDCLTTPSLMRHGYQSSECMTLGTVTCSFMNSTSSTSDLHEYIEAGSSMSSVMKNPMCTNSTQRSLFAQLQSDTKSLKSAKTSTCVEKITAESGVQSDKETYNKSICTDTAYNKPGVEKVTSASQTHNEIAVQILNPIQCEAEVDPQHSPYIGRSQLISVCMLSNSVCEAKTQTEVICNETATAALPQTQLKSACIITSQDMTCKPLFDASRDPLDGGQVVLCACTQIGSETNDNCLTVPVLDCPTQTDLQRDTSGDLATVLSNCTHKCLGSEVSEIDQMNKQIQSLSQLMAQRKSSHAEPCCPPVSSVVLSSNLNAAKWIKKCTSFDKHYQSMIDPDRSTPDVSSNASSKFPIDALKKFHSLQSTRPSYRQPDIHYDIPEPLPTLSKDSLADVLPINNGFERQIIAPVINSCNKVMVDKVTSDEAIAKDVKECTLQTSPDIRDAATDSDALQEPSRKSASVLTSRCILPTAANCCPNDNGHYSDCLLVYGKPHCVIHKGKNDACIQINPSIRDIELDSRNKSITQSIGLLTSCLGLSPPTCLPKPTDSHGEVLSPNVYKALYDTAKLVSKEDCPVKDAAVAVKKSSSIDTEIGAAVLQAAGLQAPGCNNKASDDASLCHCKTVNSQLNKLDAISKRKEASTPGTAEMFTQTCPYCCAKLLELPTAEINPIEECVKTHLVASCRYYSNLLTKQLGRVKDNLRKNMTPSIEACLYQIPDLSYTEACTMKPSGREDLGCQTIQHKSNYKPIKRMSCCALSPAVSLTDICRYDKEHLKSVYYILTSIEGRLRRLKTNLA